MLGNFYDFLTSTNVFLESKFLKSDFRNTTRVSNSLDPDQGGFFVGSDVGPYCLQMLSADVISR